MAGLLVSVVTPEDNRATGKAETVDCLRTIAAEERKVYSRIIDHLISQSSRPGRAGL